MNEREKVIKGMEWLLENMVDPFNDFLFSGYDGPVVMANKPIIEAAHALLKAQASRVLTLEEYKAIAERPLEERVPVWLEWRGGSGRWTIPERAYQGYGVNWRCWTGKPSAEEREAATWP